MKRFTWQNKRLSKKLLVFSFCLILLTNLLVGVLSFTPLSTPTVYAANNANTYCAKIIAADSQADPEDVSQDSPFFKSCKTGYDYGYKNPNQNDAGRPIGPCYEPNVSSAHWCTQGFNQGKIDKKAESSNPQPTPAQIKTAAEKACKPYKEEDGVSSENKTKNFNACVAGYTGQKNGDKFEDACKTFNTGPSGAACLKGWNAAIDSKPVVPGSGGAAQTGSAAEAAAALPKDDDKELDCDADANPLTWIICPVVDGLVALISKIDNMITDQLSIETDTIFGSTDGSCASGDTCDAYYKAWRSFRNIALGLMVIAGLVILISQALGMEILDAYTIRKTLPRILVAAVGVTLSWPLMKLAVELTNDLGFGIRNLIYAPFSELSNTIDLTFGNSLITAFFGAGALTLLGVFGLLSYAGTAALAVFIGIVVLILRQVAIILLMLLAPIAIIAYILPNTSKVYKFWWESFSKALLMFPLIAAFIATGRVFSAIAINNSSSSLNQMIGFAAYFAPYFLIPLTFKFAGGFVRQLGGFVNDRGTGGFDRLRKFRSGQAQKNTKRLHDGTRYEGKSWIPGSTAAATRFGKVSRGVGTGWNGRFGLGPRGAAATRAVKDAAAQEAQKDEYMRANAGNNKMNRVLAMGMGDERVGHEELVNYLMAGGDTGKEKWTRPEAVAAADKAVREARVAGFTEVNGIAAALNMAADGTAIRDEQDMARLAAKASGGDGFAAYDYAAKMASISRQASRQDLAAASEPAGALAQAMVDQMYHGGVPTVSAARELETDSSLEDKMFDSWKSGAGGEQAYMLLSNAKGRTISNITNRAVGILTETNAAGEHVYTPEQRQAAAVALRELEIGADNNLGKANNRERFREIMNADGGQARAALEDFMQQPTGADSATPAIGRIPGPPTADGRFPTGPVGHRPETYGDRVEQISKDRYAGLTPQQRAELERRDGAT